MKLIYMLIFTFLFCQIPERRVVAEWESSIGTMIRWPLGIPMDLVFELAEDDKLFVLVENLNQQNLAINSFNSYQVNISNVEFVISESYSHWTRDYGPQFIIGQDYWKVINQQFNGYPEENGCNESIVSNTNNYLDGRIINGESRGWEEDDDSNIDFANYMNWDIKDLSLYFTGGNFMTDGYGTGFSTQLMANENEISNNHFLQIVRDELYLSDYHFFENPNELSIQHIDCLAKLVNSETVIIKQVPQSSPEYDCIENFAQAFSDLNTFYGRPFKIFRIYCPVINGGMWEVNPVAAYTNSLILNSKVLVPQYGSINSINDENALNIYREAMPGYEVIGFYNNTGSPWYAEDALHCRTIGIFNPNMLHISHKSIRTEEIINNNQIYIEAEVIDYSNTNIESVFLNWKYESEESFNEIQLELETNNIFSGYFPVINANSTVNYFISSISNEGNYATNPNAGFYVFNSLEINSGDVNNDGLANIQDVILVINLVLNESYDAAADLNLDNEINVLDIIELVNIILN